MSISSWRKLLLVAAAAALVVACKDDGNLAATDALSVAKSEISKNSTETATPIDTEGISTSGFDAETALPEAVDL